MSRLVNWAVITAGSLTASPALACQCYIHIVICTSISYLPPPTLLFIYSNVNMLRSGRDVRDVDWTDSHILK